MKDLTETMMKTIVVIVPYFGKLPSFYPMWEKSVLYNDSIDFVLLTDDLSVSSKENLKVIQISFDDYRKHIQSKFPFDINLKKPYKLCDFKPAIGHCFPEIIKNYDFWGYCDLDLTFGDIRKFITNQILCDFDKIFITAHFSLFRNTPKMVSLFMDNGEFPEYNYQEAFTATQSCYFDEFRGMEIKCLRNNIKVYSCEMIADYNPSKALFFNQHSQQVVLIWKEGKLYEVEKNGRTTELLYAHYQKRAMNTKHIDSSIVYIVPGLITSNIQDSNELFQFASGHSLAYTYNFKSKKLLKAFSSFGILGLYKRFKRSNEIQYLKKQIKESQKSLRI